MKRLLGVAIGMTIWLAVAASQGNAAPREDTSGAQKYFSDVVLVNQNGAKLRFYSDLLKGKTVVIHSFFSTCADACPPMMHTLTQLQQALGDHLGRDVLILSFTVDPTHDTPGQLKEYAGKWGAKAGWHFLTGKKENVDWALYKLGQYVEAKEDHSTLFIVGNESKEAWRKVPPTVKTEELIRILQGTLNGE